MKNLPGYIATHPVALSMAYLIVLCTGVFSLINLPLEFTPDIDLPSLTIEASWPSASPETIEMLVTAPIEAVCSTAAGVQNIESTSKMGLSEVKVEYSTDTNIDYSALTLSEKLAALRETLPFGVTPPQIIRHAPQEFLSRSIMTVYLIGNTTISALNRCANTDIRQKLLTINGISAIRISGGSEQAVCIEIDTKKCSALHLDPSAISAVLQQKEDQSFGAIEQGNIRRLVHVDNPAASVDEISRWEIENTPQRTIRIQDIATVRVTDVPPQRLKRINGLPTIVIDIDKTPGTHLLKLARTLRNKISTIEKELPAGINMVIQYDQSETMHQDIRDLAQRGFFSLLVVFMVLLIMMRGLYAPFVILSSIFFSVLLTLNFYFLARLTLNILTLSGFALGFGMFVDNSIVVHENITRHFFLSRSAVSAALNGSIEVFPAATASTLTTIAAFVPLFFMSGDFRLYYLHFAAAVSLALLASLLVAFTFTTSLTVQGLLRDKRESPSLTNLGIYHALLKKCRQNKAAFITSICFLFLTTGFLFFKYVARNTIWSFPQKTTLAVAIQTPKSLETSRVDEIIQDFEKTAQQDKKYELMMTDINENFASLLVTFSDSRDDDGYPFMLQEKMVLLAARLGGVQVSVSGLGEEFVRGVESLSAAFSIQVFGYNYRRVQEIAADVSRVLDRYPQVREVRTSAADEEGQNELMENVILLNHKKMSDFGVSSFITLHQLHGYLDENLYRHSIRIHGDEFELQTQNTNRAEMDFDALQKLAIKNAVGQTTRLRQLATIGRRTIVKQIERKNQQYRQVIQFQVTGTRTWGEQLVQEIVANTHLPSGYRLERISTLNLMSGTEFWQIIQVILISVLLVFIITAIFFESIKLSLMVLTSLPLGLIGVFSAFLLTGHSFDRGGYLGIILLSGIVVNNSILLVAHMRDQIRDHRGRECDETLFSACRDRLRPIMMTSLTTIIGMLPLALQAQQQSIWKTMALTTIGGMISSTLLVLIFIPILYLCIQDHRV